MDGKITDLDAVRAMRNSAREEPATLPDLPNPVRWVNGTFINHDALMEVIVKARNADVLPSRVQIGWRVVVLLNEDNGPFTAMGAFVAETHAAKAFEAIVTGVHFGDTHDYDIAIPVVDQMVYVVTRVPGRYVLPLLRNADK